MKTIGRTEFDFVCEECGKIFKTKTSYDKHLKTHLREKEDFIEGKENG